MIDRSKIMVKGSKNDDGTWNNLYLWTQTKKSKYGQSYDPKIGLIEAMNRFDRFYNKFEL